MFSTLLTAGVLGFIGLRLVSAAHISVRSDALRRRSLEIVRGVRWRHIWPVPFVLTVVIIVAALLVQLPVLSFGWWTALGGAGNPVTGATDQTAGTILAWLIPVAFLLLLLPALPLFAYREEEMFRLGAELWSWQHRVGKAVQFGLVHVIIGIPIGVALALSIGGGYFQWVYLRGFRRSGDNHTVALLESTRAHMTYNAVIVAVVLVAIAGGGLS